MPDDDTLSPQRPAARLDTLPVELLSHIVQLAAPLEYTEDKYRERRELLRRLCLVCKLTRDVAQPMLPEVFEVRMEPDDAPLCERGQSVRVLVLNECYDAPCPAEVALGACRNVVDLRLLFLEDFDLGLLAELKNLRHLLASATSLTCPPNLVLPNLLTLALASPELRTSVLEDVVTSTCLPSLHSLAIDLTSDTSWDYGTRTLPDLPASLLEQLDVLCVDLDDIPLGELHTLRPARVLVDFHWQQYGDLRWNAWPGPSALRLHGIEHLAIDATDPDDISTSTELLKTLHNFASYPLARAPRVLILPEVLNPTRRKQHHLVEKSMQAILKGAWTSGVKVLWEPTMDWHCESRLSSAFREWVFDERRMMQRDLEFSRAVVARRAS
ncbi:hypothetical protein JCM6882_000500 [Rhodosporidiobolus microsporus]